MGGGDLRVTRGCRDPKPQGKGRWKVSCLLSWTREPSFLGGKAFSTPAPVWTCPDSCCLGRAGHPHCGLCPAGDMAACPRELPELAKAAGEPACRWCPAPYPFQLPVTGRGGRLGAGRRSRLGTGTGLPAPEPTRQGLQGLHALAGLPCSFSAPPTCYQGPVAQ